MLVYRSEVFSRSSSLWPQHHSYLILPWHVYGVWWCLGSPFFSSSTTGQAHRLSHRNLQHQSGIVWNYPPTHLWFQWHFSRFTSRFPSLKMLPHKSGWLFEPASWGPGERGKSFGKNLPIPTTTKARGSSRRVAALLWDPGLQTRWVWTNVFQTF